MLDQIDRTLLVMSQMQLYSRNCSIRFLKEPNRLELKYERSFTMAVKKNRQHLITKFPRYSVKAVYVSCSQIKDIREFKARKRAVGDASITTPLHLACQLSNEEAARVLIEEQNYDVNILLYEKNFLFDLLNTGSFEDFRILSRIFKDRCPCVNSGSKMPLN